MGPPSSVLLSSAPRIKPTQPPLSSFTKSSHRTTKLPSITNKATTPEAALPPPHGRLFHSTRTTREETRICVYKSTRHRNDTRGRQHGKVPVLRAGAHQQGRLDQGGGPAAHSLHQGPRRGLLEIAAQGRRAAPVREELPAAVDQLPEAGPQARQLHRGGGRAHHQVPRAVRQQVVADRREAARPDGQRDQKLLEHAHQTQAPRPRHRPSDPPPNQCRRRRSAATATAAALPATGAKTALRCISTRPSSPPAAARSLHRSPIPLAGGVQPQQRRRAPVGHSAAAADTAPRHRPQPVHQPRSLPAAAGGIRQQAIEASTGDDDDDSRQHQCDAGMPVPEQPRVPAGRRVRLWRRILPAAGAAVGSQSFTSSALLQRPIV